MGLYDQRRVLSRAELKKEIELRLARLVPGNMRTGPNDSALMKASNYLEEIMALVDSYAPPRR